MAASVARDKSRLSLDSDAAAYFYPKGKALEEGSLLKNQAYAETLDFLAQKGGDSFYHSAISQAIIDKVQQASNKGHLSQGDL